MKTWIDGKPGIVGTIAVLTKWRKVGDQYDGVVFNHPQLKDGAHIRTSLIIEEDGDVIVTQNTTYRLEGEEFDPDQTTIDDFIQGDNHGKAMDEAGDMPEEAKI